MDLVTKMTLRCRLLTVGFFLMVSCGEVRENPRITEVGVQSALLAGSWQITHFIDNNDRTSLFKDYLFLFDSTGTVRAAVDTIVQEGTWTTMTTGGKISLQLDFDALDTLRLINNDWIMLESSDRLLRMQDSTQSEARSLTLIRI